MSFLTRLLGREERAQSVKSSDPYLAEFFGMRDGAGGGFVDPSRASGHAVAHRCIQVIAENLAAVPGNLYRRTGNGARERATDHPLYGVLHDMANPQQTAFEARELLIVSLLVSGNAFARIDWNGRGQATAIHPLAPGSVAVERLATGRLRYKVSDPRGGVTVHLQEEVLHLRYRLAADGIMGLSPLQIARETFNLALAENSQTAAMMKNGLKLSGAFVFPEKLSGERGAQMRSEAASRFAGALNAGNFLVLDGGVDFKTFSMPAKDAELLESRKLSNLDVCRVYGVPPTVAGITDNATYSNTDQESRALVARCLAPMAKRLEQAMNAGLLASESRRHLFIEHDLAGLLRGDQKARYEAYRIGREWGWLSPNEIRGWENLAEIEGGDEYLSPLNMTPLGQRGEGEEGARP